jgi:hypothetical protein
LAPFGHFGRVQQCPLSGVKRRSRKRRQMSPPAPKRTMTASETFHRVPAITLNATGI